jgi:hypothetical protein
MPWLERSVMSERIRCRNVKNEIYFKFKHFELAISLFETHNFYRFDVHLSNRSLPS